jgi:ABC-type antimicrobial peptide transport system permease subunit
MEEVLDRETGQRRLQMQLLSAFAALALLLAALGIYGVLASRVACRTQEIGVRVALGAAASDIVGAVLARGLGMAAAGIAAGLLGAAALARLMAHMLFGVKPVDGLTYAIVAAAGLLVSALACYLPARRATRIDPIQALRCE